jgi:hypothetical protein
MSVNFGPPNADDLAEFKHRDLIFVAVRGQWHIAEVVVGVFSGCITFQVLNGNRPNYPAEVIKKWTRCEFPSFKP